MLNIKGKNAMQELGPNQTKWLEALESGEYKQGFNALCRVYPDGTVEYCCLGVANELFSKKQTKIKDCSNGYVKGWDDDFAFAAKDTTRKLALYSKEGHDKTGSGVTIAMKNDDEKTFKEIAAMIRENPSVYFKEPR